MKKINFVSKRFFIAIVFAFLFIANIQIASAQNINGAWEKREKGVLWVISFIEDTFVIFKDGEIFQYGTYTLNPADWGVKVSSNNPQNLAIEFGFERSYNAFTCKISGNELTLSNPLRSSDGYLFTSRGELPISTYKRSSEPSETGNSLLGAWRIDFKDEGKDYSQVFRFFPKGEGVVITFPRQYSLYDAGLSDITYEFGTTRGKGQISVLGVDTSTPIWGSVILDVLQFSIDGNTLRLTRNGKTVGDYKKR